MNRPFVSPSTDSLHHNMPSDSITQDSHVTINQQIGLTEDQFELLNVISKAHDKSISERMINRYCSDYPQYDHVQYIITG
jgi:hypothetical protein